MVRQNYKYAALPRVVLAVLRIYSSKARSPFGHHRFKHGRTPFAALGVVAVGGGVIQVFDAAEDWADGAVADGAGRG